MMKYTFKSLILTATAMLAIMGCKSQYETLLNSNDVDAK